MYFNYECSNGSNQSLGVLLCLLVMGYIYYFHTTSQQKNIPQLQEQSQNPIDDLGLPSPPYEFTPSDMIKTPYDRGYYDGVTAYLHFDIADVRSIKEMMQKREHDLKERERSLEKRLEEFEGKCTQMQSTIKEWREEYQRTLWEVKQKDERGLTRWWKFGSSRTLRETEGVEVKEEVTKGGDQRTKEKEVILEDVRYRG